MRALTVFRAYKKAESRLRMANDSIMRFENEQYDWSTEKVLALMSERERRSRQIQRTEKVLALISERERRSRQIQRFDRWLEANLSLYDGGGQMQYNRS